MQQSALLVSVLVVALATNFATASDTKLCKDDNAFDSTADPNIGSVLCGDVVSSSYSGYLEPFTASYDTCKTEITFGGSTSVRFRYISFLASKCCVTGNGTNGTNGSSTAGVCDEYYVPICKDMANFKYDATNDVTAACYDIAGTSSSSTGGGLDPFTASATTCAEAVTFASASRTRYASLEAVGSACCNGQDHACKDYQSAGSIAASIKASAVSIPVLAIAFATFLAVVGK